VESKSSVAASDEAQVLYRWSARRVQPVVLLYVAAVFVGMMSISHFVVHSAATVKALALTVVGAIVSLVPAVAGRMEYRLTEQGLEQRSPGEKKSGGFKHVFQMDQLSRVVPKRHGFKYYKKLDESNAVRRFWKLHFSDVYSGEVHAEATDQERVLEILSLNGIRCR